MIKLINYLPYGVIKEEYISKSSIDNMFRESEFKGDGFTSVCMNGGYHLRVKETPEEILAMPDIEEGSNTIDWEQRRYEIAMHMLPQTLGLGTPEMLAINAMSFADALIEELKKGGKK